jgi:hypothetical protein
MEQDATAVLLVCLGYTCEATKTERLAHLSAEKWRMVAELAQHHRVAPLLYHYLQRMNMALPGDVAEKLKQKYRQNSLRNMRLYQELHKLLRLLQEKDTPVIVLKGAYLAEAVYADIALRTMRDVDLLVKKDHLLRVEQELLALGCVPEGLNRAIGQDYYHFGYKLPRNGLLVEIHWMLNSSYPIQNNVEGLWSRAQPVMLAQAPALALSPEDLLLHLCQHTAKHAHDMHLRMLCDIGEVVRRYGAQLDWQEIGARARQWGILRAVYVILRLARELLEVTVPVDWLTSLQPDDFDERYLDLTRERIIDTRAAWNMKRTLIVAQMWGAKGLGSKLALMSKRLLLSREIMALKYPATANSWRIYLYYPARIKYVLLRNGATLWRLLRGDLKTRTAAEHTNEITALQDWLMSG